MKILFLDFDGVLNSRKFLNEQGRGDLLDPRAVETLTQIVYKTKCEIVVSSTWRILHSIPDLSGILLEQGGYQGSILDVTPRAKGFNPRRGDEIDAWLSQHPEVTSYVILDDEDYDMNEHQRSRLVKTSFETGLQRQHYERVVQLFDTERPVTTP